MSQFKAMDPRVEVNGQTVMAIVDGMGAFKEKAYEILARNGIQNILPNGWYSQQGWLDAFKEIHDTIGPATLFGIGLKIPENAQFPPEIDTIQKALSAIDVAYHMNHRNGEIGHYTFTLAGDRQGRMVCDNPYPCDFDRGIIETMAKKFKPKASLGATVVHDDARPCRKTGASSCTYAIRW